VSTPDPSVAQRIARYALILFLVALGVWMLRRFLPALAWAVVLAIATSSLYDRWLARFQGKRRHIWAAATFTTLVALVVIVPLIYGAVLAVNEALSLSQSFLEFARNGPPQLPRWVDQIPWIGDWVRAMWVDQFGHLGEATRTFTPAKPEVLQWTRVVGIQLVRRVTTLVFALLTLFFVYLNRDRLSEDVPRVSRRIFGPSVERLLKRAVDGIRAAVDGIVLVAVAEGALMGVVYALVGATHPILLGAVTGIFATVPFAAPVVFGVVAVLLAVEGSVGAAITVVVCGTIMLFIADHFVRPAIIGGAARLPFLWVLLGILGGIESFGLIGLFLGPALMAALVSLWRGWVAEIPAHREPGGD
jgi:predicted PurR-regulated permease PerM